MFACPVCRTTLEQTKTENGLVWACERCGGHAATVAILRKSVEGAFVSRLWGALLEGKWLRQRQDRPCPSCAKPMGEITRETVTGPMQIDVCRPCQFFWFDLGESQQLPVVPPGAPEPELHPRVREALALAEIERIRRRHETGDFEDGAPDEWWQVLASIVGMPVEHEAQGLLRWPILTWGIALLVLAVGVLSFGSLEYWVRDYGFVPADPFRHGGLTLLTSFLLHGGWVHLLGNLYFLLVFGDDVEDVVGHARFLLLLAAAALVGDFCHLATDPDSTVPSIGASGGISGVIAFYAFAFPRARIGLFVRFGWIRLSARWAFALWLGVQAFGTWQQLSGFVGVNYLAHLGGAAAGLLCWLVWRERGIAGDG